MDENWTFTRAAVAASEPERIDLDADDRPVRGNALLRLLAEESGGSMVEASPGHFIQSKLAPREGTQ